MSKINLNRRLSSVNGVVKVSAAIADLSWRLIAMAEAKETENINGEKQYSVNMTLAMTAAIMASNMKVMKRRIRNESRRNQ
jgi:hypothetical protein